MVCGDINLLLSGHKEVVRACGEEVFSKVCSEHQKIKSLVYKPAYERRRKAEQYKPLNNQNHQLALYIHPSWLFHNGISCLVAVVQI